jgi:hypothetical protein
VIEFVLAQVTAGEGVSVPLTFLRLARGTEEREVLPYVHDW